MASLSRSQIRDALRVLDDLAQEEYGASLETLLLSGGELASLRLERLTGIALKRPFAIPRVGANRSATNARRSWSWSDQSLDSCRRDSPDAFAVLEELRSPGPWNRSIIARGAGSAPVSWDHFKRDVEHERGLFKVLALYVADRLSGTGSKSLRAYIEASESRRFEAGLDLAVLVSDAALMSPIAALIGVPEVAVGLALIGIQFGYRRFTEENRDRGDNQS